MIVYIRDIGYYQLKKDSTKSITVDTYKEGQEDKNTGESGQDGFHGK